MNDWLIVEMAVGQKFWQMKTQIVAPAIVSTLQKEFWKNIENCRRRSIFPEPLKNDRKGIWDETQIFLVKKHF